MTTPNLAYLLIYLLVGGLIIYVAIWAMNSMNLPQPWRNIVIVVIAIVAILFLLRLFNFA